MWGRGARASWANQPRVPGFRPGKVTEAVPRTRPREIRHPSCLGGALSSPTPGSHPARGAPPASAPPPGSPWKPAAPREELEEESAECPQCVRRRCLKVPQRPRPAPPPPLLPRGSPGPAPPGCLPGPAAARCGDRRRPGVREAQPEGGSPGTRRDGRRLGTLPGRQAVPGIQLPGLGRPERVGFPQQCGKNERVSVPLCTQLSPLSAACLRTPQRSVRTKEEARLRAWTDTCIGL